MARDYGKVTHRFWTGETGKKIRARGLEVRVVATYLLTCSSSNMIGLYYIPVALIAHEAGTTLEGASKALRSLSEDEFAYYDEDAELVFIPQMARVQIGESLKQGDKQRSGVIAQLKEYKNHKYVADFVAIYKDAYHLPDDLIAKPLRSPLPSPSDAREQRAEIREQRTEKKEVCAETAKPSSPPPPTLPALLTFPCDGKQTAWNLTQKEVDGWKILFPTLDIVDLCREALAWILAQPARRKTASGMPKFLTNWFTRAKNNPPRPPSTFTPRNEFNRQEPRVFPPARQPLPKITPTSGWSEDEKKMAKDVAALTADIAKSTELSPEN